jgi:phage terminase large subunit-like protein
MGRALKKKQTAGDAARRAGDDVTAYALDVVAGDIVAGPHVRAACRRHLNDLETGAERGLYFDPEAAADFFDFCEALCTVLVDGATAPLVLSPAQRFKTGSLFGWKRADGWRRFQTAYIEEGKGNGKSPTAAAVGLYGMVADGEERAEIYAAATKKDQAMILFRDAVSMRVNSPDLRSALVPSGGNPVWQLTNLRTASFFKPIANDDGQSGPRPHFALVDEVHEVKDKYTIEMLKAGFKARKQPLLFMITNSGSDRNSVAFEYHTHGIEVVNGDKVDDSFFAYICALDDGDDPFADESCWPKANPELGNVIKVDYLRKQVDAAKMLPSYQNAVLRLNFCVWTDADRAWIRREAWESCEVSEKNPTPGGGLGGRRSVTVLREEDFSGEKAYGGLDLSWSQDLTARALTFKDTIAGIEHLYSFVKFWTPADTLRARSNQDWRDPEQYPRWVDQGYLIATPGKVVPMQAIGRQLHEDQQAFDLQFVAYDRYRHKDLEDKLAEEGYTPPMLEHPQGFRRFSKVDERLAHQYGWFDERGQVIENPLWMPGSIEAWEHAIIEGRFHTPFNPVLRWNVAGVFPQPNPSGTGDIIFNKRKATGRIDGAVACAMSVGAAVARFGPEGSALDDFLSNPVMTI